jgi:1-phosphofructokinase family hexose kinase
MILTVTPNPSIDRSLVVCGYRMGKIHRPEQVVTVAGGKGLNVARTIKRLGGSSEACTILAGHNGHWILEQLELDGIPAHTVWGTGETRICTSIIDTHSKQITEIYESGVPIDPKLWGSFEETVAKSLPGAEWITFSGSLPPGAPVDGYTRLLRLAVAHGMPAILDIHGEPLRQALHAKPAWVKINASEISEITQIDVKDPQSAVLASNQLMDHGVRNVIITLGEFGAVSVSAEGNWCARPPHSDAIATVGSGDAFLGGFILALSNHSGLAGALAAGVATGSANALEVGQAIFNLGTRQKILEEIEITKLD